MLSRPSRTIRPVLARWVRYNSHEASAFTLREQLARLTEETRGLDPKSAEKKIASTIIHGRAIHEPHYHPHPYNIPVASIQFRSYIPHFLDFFTHFVSHAASALAIPITRPAHLPVQRSLWTVPKGPFAHKKAQENFERKVYRRAIKAYDADQEVVERWLRYIQKHRMASVGMRITRWERAPVGVGEKLLQNAMGRVRSDALTDAQKVKALGDKIVRQELAAQADGVQGIEPPPKS